MGRFDPPSKKVQVDVRLDDVVLHALEREPARRYQKASEVRTGVDNIAATMKPCPKQKGEIYPEPKQQPAAGVKSVLEQFGFLFLMAFVLIAIFAWLVLSDHDWNMRTNAAQPAKGGKETETTGNSKEPDTLARMNEHHHGVKLKLVKVDSEEHLAQSGYGENAVDGDPDTFWETQWQGHSPGLPHEIIIELLPASVIKGFTYLPRQDESDHGTIRDYEFYVSDDGTHFGKPVKTGAFKPTKEKKTETFQPVKCRFIKLKAISEINGLPWTSVAEIGVVLVELDSTSSNNTGLSVM
jgi:hypothetical protein